MSDYYQQNLQHVKQVMSLMELKKKSKGQLIDLANLLGTQTIGTKESLITTMAMKITSLLLQDDPDTQKYTVEQYMQLPALRMMPQNSKEFLKQVIRNYKKQLNKQAQKEGRSIITNSDVSQIQQSLIQQPKPFYSFNPTFQNYNFIPLFQNNMNFNGANNYLNQIMGQHQPVHAIHTIPNTYGHYPNYPFVTPVPTSSVGMLGMQDASTTGYPYIFNNAMIGKQPQLMPILSSTPIQMATSSPIDQRMMLSNPTLNPLMFSQTQPSLAQSQTTTSLHTQSAKSTTNTKLPSKRKSQSASLEPRQAKRDYEHREPVKQSQLRFSEGQSLGLESKCICNGANESRSNAKLTCQSCSNTFHQECMNMTDSEASDKGIFECPVCTLRTMNPLNEVVTVLKEQIVNYDKLRDKIYFTSVRLDRKTPEQFIEIRSIKLDGSGQYDITWPDSATVRINDELVQEFKPLQYLSSVKKRKDMAIPIDPVTLKKYSSLLTIKVEVKPLNKEQLRNYRINEGSVFAIGVYIVNNVAVDSYVKQVSSKKKEVSWCKKIIESNISKANNSEVQIQMLSIGLNDPYNLEKIKLPARGKYCEHAQCFSLDTFVLMMSSTQYPNWRCPVCKRRCFSLYVDTYMLGIIQQAKAAGDLAKQVSFDTEGNYFFSKQAECIGLDDDHQPSEQPQPPIPPTEQKPSTNSM